MVGKPVDGRRYRYSLHQGGGFLARITDQAGHAKRDITYRLLVNLSKLLTAM